MSGFPSGHHRIDDGGDRAEGFGLRAVAFGFGLPLSDGIEGFFAQGLVAQNLPAWEEDGEDFNEDDGETYPANVRNNSKMGPRYLPLWRDPDRVDRGHAIGIETDQPHGCRRKAVHVRTSQLKSEYVLTLQCSTQLSGYASPGYRGCCETSTECRERQSPPKEPGQAHLATWIQTHKSVADIKPCDHQNLPLPAATLLGRLFHWSAVNLSAGNTPRGMIFARNKPH